jgi:pentatricopeptide repeat protein
MDKLKAIVLDPGSLDGALTKALQESEGKDSSFAPRPAAFTSLLQLCSKTRQLDKGLELWKAMTTVNNIQPNTFTYSAMISLLGKAGRVEDAEQLFDEMMSRANDGDQDCRPNNITFSSLLSAYTLSSQLDKALNLFHYQKSLGIHPDLITYHSLFHACEAGGNKEVALSLIDDMHLQGLHGTTALYNTVLKICLHHGDWESGLNVWLVMQLLGQANIQSSTVSLMLRLLSKGGMAGHLIFLLTQIAESGFDVDVESVNVAVDMLTKDGHHEAVDKTLPCIHINESKEVGQWWSGPGVWREGSSATLYREP